MLKEEINKHFSELENMACYIYISGIDDLLYITDKKLTDEDKENKRLYIFSENSYVWEKKDICELIDAFYIKVIIFPDGKAVKTQEFKINRPLNYIDNLKRVQAPYIKKIIFLEKKTRAESLLYLLSHKNFIVLAKPSSPKSIEIDIYTEENHDNINGSYLPAFSDSDTLREFLKNKKDNECIKDYKPLLMKFSEIARYTKKNETCSIYINPVSYSIKNKNFTFKISPQLLFYISNTIEKKFNK